MINISLDGVIENLKTLSLKRTYRKDKKRLWRARAGRKSSRFSRITVFRNLIIFSFPRD